MQELSLGENVKVNTDIVAKKACKMLSDGEIASVIHKYEDIFDSIADSVSMENGKEALYDEDITFMGKSFQFFVGSYIDSDSGKYSCDLIVRSRFSDGTVNYSEPIMISLKDVYETERQDDKIKLSKAIQGIADYMGFYNKEVLYDINDNLKSKLEKMKAIKVSEGKSSLIEKYLRIVLVSLGKVVDMYTIKERCIADEECYKISLREFNKYVRECLNEDPMKLRKQLYSAGLMRISSNANKYPFCVPARISYAGKEPIPGKGIALKKIDILDKIIERSFSEEG